MVFGLVVGDEEDEDEGSESVMMDSPDRWDVLGLGQAMVCINYNHQFRLNVLVFFFKFLNSS